MANLTKQRDLKPCPFCGAKLVRRMGDAEHNWRCYYEHPDNQCVIFGIFDGYQGIEEYRAWNKRYKEEK